MDQLIDGVVQDFIQQGYVGEHISYKPPFHSAIATLAKELQDTPNTLPGTSQGNLPSYFLILDLHHHPSNLKMSLDFCYQLPEQAEKLQCRRLLATSGEASRVYKINYDHPVPNLQDVVSTLQAKLKMTPFLKNMDAMLDNMNDHYYNRIKSVESNKSIVDVIRRKVHAYHDYQDIGKTRLLSVPGKYNLLRNYMDTTIVVELNKGKEICQIKQIENYQENTKNIFLPGKKQHLDTPFEMLTLLSEKHEIEKGLHINKKFEHLPQPVSERLARRK